MFEPVGRDLRTGLRRWAKRPGFTALIVVTLAVGIGANAAVFSVVDTVLLSPLPYRSPERLVVVRTQLVQQGTEFPRSSGPEILDLLEQASSLESLGGIWQRPAALTDEGSEPEDVEMAFVTAGFLSVLGVVPALGRDILPEEDVEGAPPAIVLSDGLWRRRYGADPDIVGNTVEMDGRPHTVVGVMPRGFTVHLPPDAGVSPSLQAWVAWGGGYRELERSFRVFTVVGRLASGTSLPQARAQFESIAERVAADHPDDYARSGLALHLQPLHGGVTAAVRPTLLVLSSTVVLVLFIACANAINLLLIRTASMETEFQVRAALGASRGQLVRQLVSESVVLALAGGALGLLFAAWGIGLVDWLTPGDLPRLEEIGINPRVWILSLVATTVCGVVIGLVSSVHLTRPRSSFALRTRASGDRRRQHIRSVLVVSEVAFSLVVLVAAALLMRSFVSLARVELGFESEGVTTFKLSLIDSAYPYSYPPKIADFYRRLQGRLGSIPGMGSVGAGTELPLDTGESLRSAPYSYERNREPIEWGSVAARYATVTPGWFETLKIPLREGRPFEWTDDLAHPDIVVVDDLLARSAWPGESALGKRIQAVFFRNGDFQPTWAEVVGVVGHVRYHPALEGEGQIYVPHQQSPQRTMALVARSSLPTEAMVEAVRSEVRSMESSQPVDSFRLMEEYRSLAVARNRFAMVALAGFGGVALVLAVLGIYGVIAFGVSQRAREMGIRVALGASPGEVLRSVLLQGLRLVTPGVAIGLLVSAVATRLLESLLFEVSPLDLVTFLVVSGLLLVVATAACWLPGRRAAATIPSVAMREE